MVRVTPRGNAANRNIYGITQPQRDAMLERLRQQHARLDRVAQTNGSAETRHTAGTNAENIAWAIEQITGEPWPPPARRDLPSDKEG